MILSSRHPYHEVHKLSQNFPEGNTRKITAVYLRWLICDFIQFGDDHARIRIMTHWGHLRVQVGEE